MSIVIELFKRAIEGMHAFQRSKFARTAFVGALALVAALVAAGMDISPELAKYRNWVIAGAFSVALLAVVQGWILKRRQ